MRVSCYLSFNSALFMNSDSVLLVVSINGRLLVPSLLNQIPGSIDISSHLFVIRSGIYFICLLFL